MIEFATLIVPAFIAGVLMFLAPCTLPLVPGYLAFISGVSLADLADSEKSWRARKRILLNGVFYVLGFSGIFIFLGVLVGLAGAALVQYRVWLERIGGFFVISFGLFMLQTAFPKIQLPIVKDLARERHVNLAWLTPGHPLSSLVFGGAFAVGWSPCVGPVLGAILTLAAAKATVLQAALLLAVFSAGLGIPFLIIAGGIGYFARHLHKINRYLPWISGVGGAFIIVLGVLVLTGQLAAWTGWFANLIGIRVLEEKLIHFL